MIDETLPIHPSLGITVSTCISIVQVSLHASRSNCSFSHVEGFYHDQVFYFFPILANFASWSDVWTRLVQNFQNGKYISRRWGVDPVSNPGHTGRSRAWYRCATSPAAVSSHDWYWVVDWPAACSISTVLVQSQLCCRGRGSGDQLIGQVACQSTNQYHSWPLTAAGDVAQRYHARLLPVWPGFDTGSTLHLLKIIFHFGSSEASFFVHIAVF